MFYNVAIRDDRDNEFYNQLVFTFDSLDPALEFAREILRISDYRVEIIPIKEGE